MLTITMELADKLAADAIQNGGGTIGSDGQPIQNGYLIGGGIIKDGDALAKIEEANERMLAARIYMTLIKNRKELQTFNAIGVWQQDGTTYLDAVTIETNFIKALAKGYSRKQQAIGQLEAGVYTEHTLN